MKCRRRTHTYVLMMVLCFRTVTAAEHHGSGQKFTVVTAQGLLIC